VVGDGVNQDGHAAHTRARASMVSKIEPGLTIEKWRPGLSKGEEQ